MRPLNLNNVIAKKDGEYDRLEPGAYVCAVTDAEDFPTKQYVCVLVDIIQGPRANYFADKFYESKPFAHSIILSYTDRALPMLKGRLETISECNPGFDAVAAFTGGHEKMLVGKSLGVVFREEEYYDEKTGEFKMGSARPDRIVAFGDMDKERNQHPKPKMMTDEQKRAKMQAAGAASAYGSTASCIASEAADVEVPF